MLIGSLHIHVHVHAHVNYFIFTRVYPVMNNYKHNKTNIKYVLEQEYL